MDRLRLSARAADILRENNIRKPVKIKKHTFVVSDEDGNTANFIVKRADKMVLYTVDDVKVILDAIITTIKEALLNGDTVSIKELGIFSLRKRAAKKVIRPDNGELVDVPEQYAPWLAFSKPFKTAARLYGVNVNEAEAVQKLNALTLQDMDEDADIKADDEIDYTDLNW